METSTILDWCRGRQGSPRRGAPRPARALLAVTVAVLALLSTASLCLAEDAAPTVTGFRPGEHGGRVLCLDRRPRENGTTVPGDPGAPGEPRAPGEPVVDGDTVRLLDLDATVRLLAVDTEETYRHDQEEDEAKADFSAYAKKRRGDDPHPVKYGTPAGMNAKAFAREFFADVDQVLLVPDAPDRTRGYFGRHLGYLLVDRDGDGGFEQNYNVELVRAGHSPYFVKYGRSLLFGDAFEAAQEQARKQGIGIWEEPARPGCEHYPDYAERLEWWRERAEAIDHFVAEHEQDESFFMMGGDGVMEKLRDLAAGKGPTGAEVTLFSTVSVVDDPADGRTRGFVSHQNRLDIPVVCEEAALSLWKKLDIARYDGDLVYVHGRIHQPMTSRYRALIELRIDETSRVWREPERKE